MQTPDLSSSVYQLRVAVQGISPLIWRRLLIRSDMSLATLHAALQIVFAWSDTHLQYFRIHGKEYGNRQPGGPSFAVDPRQVPLAALRLHRGERFTYVYNFIDRERPGLHSQLWRALPPGRTDQHELCGIGGESGREQALLQEATDGLDVTRCASPATDPDTRLKWRLGGDISGVVSGVPFLLSADGDVTPKNLPLSRPDVQAYPTPPVGFDPLTATSQQLQQYGFPPRPSSDDLKVMALWQQMVEGLNNRIGLGHV
jgi:hypothetical protein